MSRLLETIHIKEGQILNLSYHNDRLNRSRRDLYNSIDDISLEDYIQASDSYDDDSVKCRVLYNERIERVEFFRYSPKEIHNLLVIKDDEIGYSHKYEDRSALTALYNRRGQHDDVLVVKCGLITDTYYCNVALLKNGQWYTPKSPLLKGTKRAYLIDLGHIVSTDIRLEELGDYQSIRLFNSMLSFGEIELPISAIKSL